MTLPALYTGKERFPLKGDIPINDLNRVPPRPAKIYTASQVASLDDCGRVNEMNAAGANNYTIPLHATVPFPVETMLFVQQVGAGLTTVVATGGVTLHSVGAVDGDRALAGQWGAVCLRQRAIDEWVMSGAMA